MPLKAQATSPVSPLGLSLYTISSCCEAHQEPGCEIRPHLLDAYMTKCPMHPPSHRGIFCVLHVQQVCFGIDGLFMMLFFWLHYLPQEVVFYLTLSFFRGCGRLNVIDPHNLIGSGYY